MTQNIVYPRIGLTGGTNGYLDDIDGDILQNNDIAIVVTATEVYIYHLNSASGVAESSPDTIAPDVNPGTKRWILVSATYLGGNLSMNTYNILADDAAGPSILDEAATATNPTLNPNRADPDTGVGWAAADQFSIVAGGVEGVRV